MCHALIDIHNHPTDIVHRDIKPTNVLLRSKGGAVLADFGIAQVGHDSHRTVLREDGKVIRHPGSPPYRSPEQTNGVDYLTPASDLYSLGLVIYEMLTGRMYAKYTPKHPPSGLNSEVPAWLDAVVDKLLKVKLEDRYQQAEDVSADIQAGLAGKPIGAGKVPVEAALPKAEVIVPAELSDDDRRAAAVKDPQATRGGRAGAGVG